MIPIGLPDGRVLAVEDRGAPKGRPVLFLHGAPGSRLIDPDPWVTAGARVRLLTFDRPGYGASTPLPDGEVPTIAGNADDAAVVIEEVVRGRVSVLGWSAGGLVALALAQRRPDLVRRVAIIGTPAHDDDVDRLSDEHRALVEDLRPDLPSATGKVAAALSAIPPTAEAVAELIGSGPADDAVRADPVFGPRLETMSAEAVRQGHIGMAADMVASTVAPWGFDPTAVDVPVTLWYGEEDELVPPAHGAWWSGALPYSDLHVVPGVGHLLPLVSWKQVLASA